MWGQTELGAIRALLCESKATLFQNNMEQVEVEQLEMENIALLTKIFINEELIIENKKRQEILEKLIFLFDEEKLAILELNNHQYK